MTIALIWAQSRNGVIGRDGDLPWHIPEDMRRFRELTMGGTVVMGRLQWESLPAKFRPLPGRRNIVVSRDPSYDAAGAAVMTSLTDALRADADVWVAGGGQIYVASIDDADRLLVTDVDLDVTGDVFAPHIDAHWHEVEVGAWLTSSTGIRYRFRELRRD